ncbi:putative Transposon TX1 [Gossypium australe]|uniref:Putative Transposon TX1 n=1 Tax=Gossypium australe TaxID=47621 RepID=A0A5B6V0M5_9ROSI|nr:putative Transposon TX1 [Gossypium australe]
MDRIDYGVRIYDDTILFLRANEKEVSNAKYILRCFEIFSCLTINFKKSCLEGFDVNEEILYRMVAIYKCKIGDSIGSRSEESSHLGPYYREMRKEIIRVEMSYALMGCKDSVNQCCVVIFTDLFHVIISSSDDSN